VTNGNDAIDGAGTGGGAVNAVDGNGGEEA